jgi:hypothetical protein
MARRIVGFITELRDQRASAHAPACE